MTITQIPSSEKSMYFLGHFEAEWAAVNRQHYGQVVPRWEKEQITFLAQNQVGNSEEVLGHLDLRIEMGVGYIESLIVMFQQRGQGIGRQLVEAAEAICQERKLHKIYLTTGRDWPERKFYESVGYTKTADIPHHYLNIDCVQMSKFF